MKILLIYPYCLEDRIHTEDAGVVPIGLYYIAAALFQNGYDVEVLNWHDINKSPGKVEAVIREKRPDIIGFSIFNANRWGGIDIARVAKRIIPTVKTVFGGIGATTLWHHFLIHFPEIDYIVAGEGEVTFLELVRCIESGDGDAAGRLPGVACRKNGKPVKNRNRSLIRNLDELPDPSIHFAYRHLALTRGCPSRCTFCGSPGFWRGKVRYHSAAYFVDQMERLHRKGISFFYISDDTFTLHKKRVIEICRMIMDRRLPVTWAAISRVDAVDEEVLLWMRRAGCTQISYGVESGSEKNRRLLNKQITTDQIETAFALTIAHGIMARAYFIYGCPGETGDTIRETMDLMDRIKPLGAIFYILDLFPGTKLYEDYKNRSSATDDIWLRRIEDIMYFEIDPGLSRDRVLAFGEKLRTHFYKNLPRYIEDITLSDCKTLYPNHADFCSRLAMTLDQGEYARVDAICDKQQTAENLYRRALTYHPDARAFLGLGIIAQKQGDYDGSVRVLSEGISNFPEDEGLNICIAVSHMNLGRFRKALSHLLKFRGAENAQPLIHQCNSALKK